MAEHRVFGLLTFVGGDNGATFLNGGFFVFFFLWHFAFWKLLFFVIHVDLLPSLDV